MALNTGTVAAADRFAVQSAAATNNTTDLFTTDVQETITSAAINTGTARSAGDVYTLKVSNIEGAEIVLTTAAAAAAGTYANAAAVVEALKQDADYADAGFTLSTAAAGTGIV